MQVLYHIAGKTVSLAKQLQHSLGNTFRNACDDDLFLTTDYSDYTDFQKAKIRGIREIRGQKAVGFQSWRTG